MRETTTSEISATMTRFRRRPRIWLSLAALGMVVIGCKRDAEIEVEATTISRPALECEELGYACTWDEVDPVVKERTLDLGEMAGLYGHNASIEDIASFLAGQSEVVYAEVLGTGVRYRLQGGRPAWVFPYDELAHHRYGGADPVAVTDRAQEVSVQAPARPRIRAASSTRSGDRAGEPFINPSRWLGIRNAYAQTSGDEQRGVAAEKPGDPKKALVISPYEWEWNREGVGHTGEIIARRAALIRDYKEENGGEVIFHADLGEFEANPAQTPARLSGEVQFDDFLHWDDYNLVVLATHGTEIECNRKVPVGGVPAEREDGAEEEKDPDMCPLIWAGRAKQSSYGAHVGVEIVAFLKNEYSEHPGLTLAEAEYCADAMSQWDAEREANSDSTAPRPSTEGGKPCVHVTERHSERLALWTPFFTNRYANGLENVILFLASCRSGIGNVLQRHFAQPGNENVAVLGFDDTVDAGDAFSLVFKMVELVDKGFEHEDILKELRRLDRTRTQHLVGRALDPGDAVLPDTPAEILDAGRAQVHGRDIVMLVSPSGAELADGGSVRVQPIADSRKPDELELRPQIIGLEERDARELELEVRVVGEGPIQEKYEPYHQAEPRVHRYNRNISLGRKHNEGEVVDLEISAEFEGGQETRWTYRDIRLTTSDCTWSVSVSGESPATGTFSGTTGWVETSDSHWPPMSVDVIVQDDDPQPEPPWLEIHLTNIDLARIRDTSTVSGISFAIPGVQPGQTGSFNRIWGTLSTGMESHPGNADYLRRDVMGIPGGTGIGKILSTNVTLSRNDERVEGSFEGRFLNQRAYADLGTYERAPVGVGMHTITGAAIHATGHFSIMADGSCRAKMGFRR